MSAIEETQQFIRHCASNLGLSEAMIKRLTKIDRVVEADLHIKMDNGELKVFKAYRAQHNNYLGPYKGGIRFHPQVNQEEVEALSVWMTLKSAILELPFGGGKGGVEVDAKKLSDTELKKIAQAYAQTMAPHLGPWMDVPAPDMNTNNKIMAWMVESYGEYLREKQQAGLVNYRAAFTGKPIILGGSQGREEATGLGGFYILQALVAKLGRKPENTTLAVQGIGNVGYWFAKFAFDAGFKIVAISNSRQGIFIQNGLNPENVLTILQRGGDWEEILIDYATSKSIKNRVISNEELLGLKVDVLVPAAIDGVIHKHNVGSIKAPIVLELANGPMSLEAESLLLKEPNKMVLPDVLCNAGGVTVSYFEWVQNLQGYYWSQSEIYEKLQQKILTAFSQIWDRYHSNAGKFSLRETAYMLGLERLSSAYHYISG